MIDTLIEKITSTIELHYCFDNYTCTIDKSLQEVKFTSSSINSLVSITKGDDWYYEPIDENELNTVDSEYILKSIDHQYDPNEKDISENYKPVDVYYLRCQPEYYYVSFKIETIGKIRKFINVKEAIIYALNQIQSYLISENNNVNFSLFELNLKK